MSSARIFFRADEDSSDEVKTQGIWFVWFVFVVKKTNYNPLLKISMGNSGEVGLGKNRWNSRGYIKKTWIVSGGFMVKNQLEIQGSTFKKHFFLGKPIDSISKCSLFWISRHLRTHFRFLNLNLGPLKDAKKIMRARGSVLVFGA